MKRFLLIFGLLFSNLGFSKIWKDFSIGKTKDSKFKLKTVWVKNMLPEKKVKPRYVNRSSPLITEKFVIYGNPVNGVKAYAKKDGKLVWHFPIASGVASPIILHKGQLYFGAGDGFFYSLKMTSGILNWKFFTNSKNSTAPIVYEDKIYFIDDSQKLYALSLAGKRLWVYFDFETFSSKEFLVFGSSKPLAYKNFIYVVFAQSQLLALDKNTGQLKWKRAFPSSQSIPGDLALESPCLYISVVNSHLFCLNPFNGKTIWKVQGGGSFFYSKELSHLLWFYGKNLYALNKKDGKRLWKKDMGFQHVSFFSTLFGKYFIYSFPSKGKLLFIESKNGQRAGTYRFGKGVSGPPAPDAENREIYFPSLGGFLYKIFLP